MYAIEMKCLQSMPLFHDVGPAKLKLLAMTGSRVTYEAGQTIVGQEAPPEAVFVVLEGEVEIVRTNEEIAVPVARRGEGYIVGDIAVLLHETHTISVVATTPVTALRIDGPVFLQLLQDVPQLSMALMRDLARRLITLGTQYVSAVS